MSATRSSQADEILHKMEECRQFLETVIRPDVVTAGRAVEKVVEEQNEYQDLQTRLSALLQMQQQEQQKQTQKGENDEDEGESCTTNDNNNNVVSNKQLVDLGHGRVFCEARIIINDLSEIYVHVGMGFHIQFSIPEALDFVNRRLSYLEQVSLHRREQEKRVLSHLKTTEMILDGLSSELQRLHT